MNLLSTSSSSSPLTITTKQYTALQSHYKKAQLPGDFPLLSQGQGKDRKLICQVSKQAHTALQSFESYLRNTKNNPQKKNYVRIVKEMHERALTSSAPIEYKILPSPAKKKAASSSSSQALPLPSSQAPPLLPAQTVAIRSILNAISLLLPPQEQAVASQPALSAPLPLPQSQPAMPPAPDASPLPSWVHDLRQKPLIESPLVPDRVCEDDFFSLFQFESLKEPMIAYFVGPRYGLTSLIQRLATRILSNDCPPCFTHVPLWYIDCREAISVHNQTKLPVVQSLQTLIQKAATMSVLPLLVFEHAGELSTEAYDVVKNPHWKGVKRVLFKYPKDNEGALRHRSAQFLHCYLRFYYPANQPVEGIFLSDFILDFALNLCSHSKSSYTSVFDSRRLLEKSLQIEKAKVPPSSTLTRESVLEAYSTFYSAPVLSTLVPSWSQVDLPKPKMPLIAPPQLPELIKALATPSPDQSPPLIFLIGPPGSGKTCLIQFLRDTPGSLPDRFKESVFYNLTTENNKRLDAILDRANHQAIVIIDSSEITPEILHVWGKYRFKFPFITTGLQHPKPISGLSLSHAHCINLQPWDSEPTLALLRSTYLHSQPVPGYTVPEPLLPAVIPLARQYFPHRPEPNRSLSLISGTVGHCSLTSPPGPITLQDVRQTARQMCHLPPSLLTQVELEAAFGKRVVHQPQAIQRIASDIFTYQRGLSNPAKPPGVYVLVGPTGVGKTETAKTAAQLAFGSEEALIRFDMSEFRHGHTVSRLAGAPPGYLGFDKGGELTNALEKRGGACAVLLDEIEKADPEVLRFFLAAFDEGRVTSATGKKLNCNNTFFFMTTNLGAQAFFSDSDPVTAVSNALATKFGPEWLGRVRVLPFFSLQPAAYLTIARVHLGHFAEELQKNLGVTLQWTPAVEEKLAQASANSQMGARPLISMIDTSIRPLLAQMGELEEQATLELDVDPETNNFLAKKYVDRAEPSQKKLRGDGSASS